MLEKMQSGKPNLHYYEPTFCQNYFYVPTSPQMWLASQPKLKSIYYLFWYHFSSNNPNPSREVCMLWV